MKPLKYWMMGISVASTLVLNGCAGKTLSSTEDNRNSAITTAGVIADYAQLVEVNYQDAITDALALQTAVDRLVESPSSANLALARTAWIMARRSYSQSEGFRFYHGPIDADGTGLETRINAWPIDEFYIDYTAGNSNAGIINHPIEYPVINDSVLKSLNEAGGEKNISLGFHAIEFLLWGQDRSSGPGGGNRPFTDYVVGAESTASNPVRRGEYLKVACRILVEDLRTVAAQWAPNASNYRRQWTQQSEQLAIANAIQGISSLSGGELAKERIGTALDTQDKEEEQSCFSDTTRQDIIDNIQSIKNIYYGQYTGNNAAYRGRGFRQLALQLNPTLAAKIDAQIELALSQAQAISDPFDQEFLPGNSAGQARLSALISTLQSLSGNLALLASKLTGKAVLIDED